MKQWIPAVALVVIALTRQSAQAYVEAPQSLGSVIAQSTHIMSLVVTSVDKTNNLIIFKKLEDLKGKHPSDVVKHAIGKGGLRPGEWQEIMNWAEVGKPAVFFHNGGASELFMGPSWYQAYPGGEWWNMSHGEPFLLRSFAGKPDKLVSLLKQILAGQEVICPCMVDGDKEALHSKKAKIQRVKVSLKIQDYNPKRDFVGWGGEDIARINGMPGFSFYAALGKVDAEAQAISTVDFNGDGKLDICLVSSSKVSLIKNDGEAFGEVGLPGLVGGARAAAWADYNGDGKLDLLLATPTGPKLYANRGEMFVDESASLPSIPGEVVTAAAWIDANNDGKPDILLATSFHGLRLLLNARPADAAKQTFAPRLSDWHTAGPFQADGMQDLDKVYPPEKAVALDAKFVGKRDKPIGWTKSNYPDGTPHNLARYEGPDNQNAIVYLYREIEVATHTELPLSLGSDDGLVVWCNGERIVHEAVSRACTPDSTKVTLKLKPGKNQLLMKVLQGSGEWAFYCKPGEPKSSGGGWFTDVSFAWGLGESGAGGNLRGDSLAVADVDNDGKSDFLFGAGTGLLVRNEGQRFRAVEESGISYQPNKVGAVFADYDADGLPDLLVPQATGCKLFHNSGNGKFALVAEAGDLTKPIGQAVAVAWGDFNNDGLPDVVVGVLRGSNRYYQNAGNGTFTDQSAAIGLTQRIYNSRAVAMADVNGDGKLDMIFNNEGQDSALLLGNTELPNAKTPILVRLPTKDGTLGGRLRVKDKAGKAIASEQISGGQGRAGQSASTARFALAPGSYQVQFTDVSGTQSQVDLLVEDKPMKLNLGEPIPVSAAEVKK